PPDRPDLQAPSSLERADHPAAALGPGSSRGSRPKFGIHPIDQSWPARTIMAVAPGCRCEGARGVRMTMTCRRRRLALAGFSPCRSQSDVLSRFKGRLVVATPGAHLEAAYRS